MSFNLILFIVVQLATLTFFIEMLRRVHTRATEYGLKDNKNTVPFGFVKLKHIIVLYVLSYLLWLVASVILYIMFVQSPDLLIEGGSRSIRSNNSVELNL